jgi:hypothetical protein
MILHESVPFLYTFSGQAPQEPGLDPILYGELPWFANFEMSQLTKYGMPGVWTHGYVDMWSPGYLGFMSSNHNGLLRMYETFGNGGANTMHRRIVNPDGPGGGGAGAMGGGRADAREWYRPLPPYAEVDWSIRNNTNYMETGVLTGLQLAAAFPDVVLDNFYRKSLHSIEAGKHDRLMATSFPPIKPIKPASPSSSTSCVYKALKSAAPLRKSNSKKEPSPKARSSSSAISRMGDSPRSSWRSKTTPIPPSARMMIPPGPWDSCLTPR